MKTVALWLAISAVALAGCSSQDPIAVLESTDLCIDRPFHLADPEGHPRPAEARPDDEGMYMCVTSGEWGTPGTTSLILTLTDTFDSQETMHMYLELDVMEGNSSVLGDDWIISSDDETLLPQVARSLDGVLITTRADVAALRD